jgi:methylated-DNA-protein-cysteine methyltransferase related protein
MVVNIVHTHMKKFPSPKGPLSLPKEKAVSSEGSFYEKVFELARQIPKGRVTTYGAIAEAAGIRLSARMVGWAMNGAGKVKPRVPAHRVVNRNGMLSGKHHFATPTLMQELLEQEGIKVKDDKILHFKDVLWVPGTKNSKK